MKISDRAYKLRMKFELLQPRNYLHTHQKVYITYMEFLALPYHLLLLLLLLSLLRRKLLTTFVILHYYHSRLVDGAIS